MVDTIKVFYLKVVAEDIPRPPYRLPNTYRGTQKLDLSSYVLVPRRGGYGSGKFGEGPSFGVAFPQCSNTPSQSFRRQRSRERFRRVAYVLVPWSDADVVRCLKMFRVVVFKILLAWMPEDPEAAVLDLICHPKESHLHRA